LAEAVAIGDEAVLFVTATARADGVDALAGAEEVEVPDDDVRMSATTAKAKDVAMVKTINARFI
jgi:hypothetical protein